MLREDLELVLPGEGAGKRGQVPIAKWPKGCFALLVPDPFSGLTPFPVPCKDTTVSQAGSLRHYVKAQVSPWLAWPVVAMTKGT